MLLSLCLKELCDLRGDTILECCATGFLWFCHQDASVLYTVGRCGGTALGCRLVTHLVQWIIANQWVGFQEGPVEVFGGYSGFGVVAGRCHGRLSGIQKGGPRELYIRVWRVG